MKWFVMVERRQRTTAMEEALSDYAMSFDGSLVSEEQAGALMKRIVRRHDKLAAENPQWHTSHICTQGFVPRPDTNVEEWRVSAGAQRILIYMLSRKDGSARGFVLTMLPVKHDYAGERSEV